MTTEPKAPRKSTSPDAKLRRRARELDIQLTASRTCATECSALILPTQAELPAIYRQLSRLHDAVTELQRAVAARVVFALK